MAAVCTLASKTPHAILTIQICLLATYAFMLRQRGIEDCGVAGLAFATGRVIYFFESSHAK